MFDKLFGGDNFVATTRALDAYALRHQVIANNLANVNTPGYKRQEVRFEDQLASALASGKHGAGGGLSAMSQAHPTVTTISATSERADGNNVNLDTESLAISLNELRFNAMAQQVGGYFNGLKAVINGR